MRRVRAFNDRLGLAITRAVGTMWAAYVFAGLALVSLPAAVRGGVAPVVSWLAQTLLQLVLLAVILVGQDLQGRAAVRQATETHDAVMAELAMLRRYLPVSGESSRD